MTEQVNTEDMTAMQRMIVETEGDETLISERISAVLELLTMRAVSDAPYTIYTDDGDAMCLFAANEDVAKIKEVLPANVKDWNDDPDFTSNSDPGDEQEDTDQQALFEDEDESSANPV